MSTTTVPPVRWAILGPGSIARRFVSQLPSCPGAALVAIGSSDPDRAARFAAEQVPDLTVRTGTYDEILADADVDAVYLSTVHTTHPQLAIAALEAGKHVLCEKPLAANHASVMAVAEVARRTGRVLLEAQPGAASSTSAATRSRTPGRSWVRRPDSRCWSRPLSPDAGPSVRPGSTSGRWRT